MRFFNFATVVASICCFLITSAIYVAALRQKNRKYSSLDIFIALLIFCIGLEYLLNLINLSLTALRIIIAILSLIIVFIILKFLPEFISQPTRDQSIKELKLELEKEFLEKQLQKNVKNS